jgi:hypothetical protein
VGFIVIGAALISYSEHGKPGAATTAAEMRKSGRPE